jgi:hypothetical protein
MKEILVKSLPTSLCLPKDRRMIPKGRNNPSFIKRGEGRFFKICV